MATYISKHTGAEIDSILDSVGNKADSSEIPTTTSQLTNNSNFVVDANYVHTDNNYSNEEKAKLEGKQSSLTAEQLANIDDIPNKVSSDEIPTALPNPNAIIFTGAVEDVYDGSVAKTINIPTGGSSTASDTTFDNAGTDLTSTDVQGVVVELNEKIENGGGSSTASQVSFDNASTNLNATNVQNAVVEVNQKVNSIDTSSFLAIDRVQGVGTINVASGSANNILISQNTQVTYVDDAPYMILTTEMNSDGTPNTVTTEGNTLNISDVVFRTSLGNSLIATGGSVEIDTTVNGEYELFYERDNWFLKKPEVVSNIVPAFPESPSIENEKNWEQPVLTSNGVWDVDDFAVRASSIYSEGYHAYRAFDNSNGFWVSELKKPYPQTLDWNTTFPTKINTLYLYNSPGAANMATGEFLASNDDVNWTKLYDFTPENFESGTGAYNVANINSENYYKYHRISFLTGVSTSYVEIGEIDIDASFLIMGYDFRWVNNSKPTPSIYSYNGTTTVLEDLSPPVAKITVNGGNISVENYYPNNSIKYMSEGNRQELIKMGGIV